MINIQSGRSMVEMLGVLAIVGVLSIGGLDMISKARKNNKIASFVSALSQLSATIIQQRRFASEVRTNYGGDYALFLKQIGKIPAEFSPSAGGGSGSLFSLTATTGNRITAAVDSNGILVITLYDLDKDTCVKVMTNNWGTRSSTRFVGITTKNNNFSCVANGTCSAGIPSGFASSGFSGTPGYPMPVAIAAEACKTIDRVRLGYKI